MLRIVSAAALALGVAGGALVFSGPAQAQVGIELGIGPGGPRVQTYDDSYRPAERRRRVIVEEDDENCRLVVRRRTNEYGEVVTRRTRVCD